MQLWHYSTTALCTSYTCFRVAVAKPSKLDLCVCVPIDDDLAVMARAIYT